MRRFILALLIAAYAFLFALPPWFGGARDHFDPLDPRGRDVERAIAARDFSRALPVALELDEAHPNDPVIALWLTEIYTGVGRTDDAASAWRRYRAITGQSDEEGRP